MDITDICSRICQTERAAIFFVNTYARYTIIVGPLDRFPPLLSSDIVLRFLAQFKPETIQYYLNSV